MSRNRFAAALLAACVTLGLLGTGTPAQAIVGGQNARVNYTFVAFLSGSGGNCSGVLIKANWVATAKHCQGLSKGRVGSINRTSGGTTVTFRSQVAHPDPVVDLRLLELTTPVNHVPVPIATSPTFIPSGLYAIGWGRTCLTELTCPNLPSIAKEYFQQVNSENNCEVADPAIFDENNEMCLFNSSSGQTGPCNGDSGGPIVKEVTETSWRLVAITSSGVTQSCAGTHSVGVDLYFQRDWIKEVVGGGLPT